ncbi:hypothetical protein GCM10027449_18950 [Sinomonas notoginsengisoli]|uniref:hypothetical protein n=1 Tax=Sinomonas notoginsengisoli TaxID=1457311 RepID=UPI001F3DF67E|nr:hypothetical protein [Sinomonas notoginsengisoli]
MSTPDVPPNGSQQPGPEEPPQREPGAQGSQARGQQQDPEGRTGRPAPRYGQYAPGYDGSGQQPPAHGQPGAGYGQQGQGYGQQPWQQPSYGQSQWQQPGMYGSAPGYGVPGPQEQRSAVRKASILLFATAAAEVVIGFFATMVTLNTPTGALRDLFNQAGGASSGISFEQFRQILGTLVWFAVAGAVVNAIVLVLCGVFLSRGRRWARALGTVFLCLTLGAFFSGGLFSLITIGLAVAGVVTMFRPGVTAFLNAKNSFANPYNTPKGPTFGNPYGQ